MMSQKNPWFNKYHTSKEVLGPKSKFKPSLDGTTAAMLGNNSQKQIGTTLSNMSPSRLAYKFSWTQIWCKSLDYQPHTRRD